MSSRLAPQTMRARDAPRGCGALDAGVPGARWRPGPSQAVAPAVGSATAHAKGVVVGQRGHGAGAAACSPRCTWAGRDPVQVVAGGGHTISAVRTISGVFHTFAAGVRPPPGFNRAWLATLPKGVDSEDRGQHAARTARAPRRMQQGVVARRHLTANIEMDAYCLVLAAAAEAGVSPSVLLLDVAEAFPSVSRVFLLEALAQGDFPPGFLQRVEALYEDTEFLRHTPLVRTLCVATWGVAQGCPMSGALL